MPKNHAELVQEIVNYARVSGVPESTQKFLVESALEYLAVLRILPEREISAWPESGLIGGFHAYVDEVIG